MTKEIKIIEGEINTQRFKPKCAACPERWTCALVLDGITGECDRAKHAERSER